MGSPAGRSVGTARGPQYKVVYRELIAPKIGNNMRHTVASLLPELPLGKPQKIEMKKDLIKHLTFISHKRKKEIIHKYL